MFLPTSALTKYIRTYILWFHFNLGLNFIFLYFKIITIHGHTVADPRPSDKRGGGHKNIFSALRASVWAKYKGGPKDAIEPHTTYT